MRPAAAAAADAAEFAKNAISNTAIDSISDAYIYSAASNAAHLAIGAAASASNSANKVFNTARYFTDVYTSDYTVSDTEYAVGDRDAAVSDALLLEADPVVEKLFETDLWHGKMSPGAMTGVWNSVAPRMEGDNSPWSFWRRWYQGFLDGQPLDWGLQTEIALLPNADWKQGAAHIAEKIREIEARRLRDASVIAEIVWFDEAAGRFDVRPTEVRRPDVLRLAVQRVEDAFEDALTLGRGQHVRETSAEAFVLRRVFDRYRDDPQRVEMDFVDIAALVARHIGSGEYPDSPELQMLVNVLTVAASEIRVAHPDVRETRERLDGQSDIEPLTEAQQETLAAALPVLRAITSAGLGEGLAEDVGELVGARLLPVPDHAPRLPAAGLRKMRPRKSVVRRLAFRIASIGEEIGRVIHRIDGNAGYKIVRIIATIATVVALLLQHVL